MSLNNSLGRARALPVAGILTLSVTGVVTAMFSVGAFDSQPEALASPQSDSSTFQPPAEPERGPGRDPSSRESNSLSGHGADFGLCQVYENEPWHYELRPEAKAQGCPTMYVDATDDPRLR